MTNYIVVLLLAFFSAQWAYAESECKGATYAELLACAEAFSPEVQSSKLELEKARASIDAASQWQNPEVAIESFQGNQNSTDTRETDISVGIPIELGGKISARKAIASGDVARAEARLFEARAKLRSELMLKLHRLRQVTHEKEVADEAINTFTKLVKQYGNRPALSPEQRLSLSVFSLSKSDYELKKSAIEDEIVALATYFQINLRRSLGQITPGLPPAPSGWPTLNTEENNKSSPQLQLLQAELERSKAEYSLAKSQAWPTLVLGPSFKMQSEGGQNNNLFGFNLSLPIPVFNMNGGGKAVAYAEVALSESRQQAGVRERDFKREELLQKYSQAVKVLTNTIPHSEIEKQHLEAEKLFIRGIVPSSLVIEAHRTSFELEKTRHERELKALESLYEFYMLNGSILEKNL